MNIMDALKVVESLGVVGVLVLQMFYMGAKLDKLAAAIYRHEGRGRDDD